MQRLREKMIPKKYFFVFCAIFLTLVSVLGLGAWLTQIEIESRTAAEQDGDPARESDTAPATPTVRRLADPPPSPAPPPAASTDGL